MNRKALVLTSREGFGELICQVLEDFGEYQAVLDDRSILAADRSQMMPAELLVVDAELGLERLPAFITDLRAASPDLRLIFIHSTKSAQDPRVEELGANYLLSNPFYLPDFSSVLEELAELWPKRETASLKEFSSLATQEILPGAAQTPAWAKDISKAAQHLTRLSLESASQAALITRAAQVWAYAGELPQPAVEELAASLAHFSGRDSTADLARFVHLNSTGEDYMLYAKPLGEDFALALVFKADMPFSKMRAQVGEMAYALANTDGSATADLKQQQIGPSKRSRSMANEGKRVVEESPLPIKSGPDIFSQPPDSQRPESAFAAAPSAPRRQGLHVPRTLLYSYVLIPRLPEHQLEGDLVYELTKWLPKLCIAFAWRLEYLSVQAERLLWTVSVSPQTSPEAVAHTMEEQLSQRIFETFPIMTKANPSGEFWARDALILGAEQPSAEIIVEYIQETRERQGIPGSR